MKTFLRTVVPAITVLISAFALLAAAPLIAQETANAEGDDTFVEPAVLANLTIVERWVATPDAIFDAAGINLADFLYIARPLIVMADSPNDPVVQEQIALLQDRLSELAARKVIIIVDTDPAAASAIRAQFRPHGFSMVLLDIDGVIALRKPTPWDVREIVHTIDRLPSRQQEIREN